MFTHFHCSCSSADLTAEPQFPPIPCFPTPGTTDPVPGGGTSSRRSQSSLELLPFPHFSLSHSLTIHKKKPSSKESRGWGDAAGRGVGRPGRGQAPAVAPEGTLWFSRPGERSAVLLHGPPQDVARPASFVKACQPGRRAPGRDNGCPSGITNPESWPWVHWARWGGVMAKTLITVVMSLLFWQPWSRRGSIPVTASLKPALTSPRFFSSPCLETGSDSPNVGNNWILNSNSSVKYSVITLA